MACATPSIRATDTLAILVSFSPDERTAHEHGLAAFLEAAQARRVEALFATSKGRDKIVAMLAHDLRFAPHLATEVEPDEQNAAAIAALLKRFGAGANCYAMSEDKDLDGTSMPLADALARVIGAGHGTFLSCVPGKLGYYEGETPGERYFLIRLV
jgi:hypothetical protein